MVTLDDLAKTIEENIHQYTEEVKIRLEKKLDETAEKIVEFIKNNAPRSGQAEAFADSFVVVANGEGIQKTLIIFSKVRGRITHLLEFGFTHRSGRFVSARPFMRPAFDTFSEQMLNDMKRIIEGGVQ
jgi:hypothetical protein